MLTILMQHVDEIKNNCIESIEKRLSTELKNFCQGGLLMIKNEGKTKYFSLHLNNSMIDFHSTVQTQLIIENYSDEFINENYLKGILCMLECL